MASSETVAHAIGVKTLRTDDLHANPHNPRMLFDRADLHVLQESIKRVGILVPLTVYRERATRKHFILDGQRRWMCAQAVGLQTVPVNEVSEPTLVQNIVTMFQIHKLRKDWELMPTALKLELLMQELQDKNERRLAALTGLDEAVVVRCKKLLSYSRRYQNMMLIPDASKRVKADFFIELYPVRNDREVNKFEWFKKDKFTDAMLQKVEAKGLRSVTDFRVVKQHINNAVKAHKTATVSRRLREFAERPELTADHLGIESAKTSASARKLSKAASELSVLVNEIDVDFFVGEEAMWEQLEALARLIRVKLKDVGRRLDQ
jgi:ParB family transcriptional regulator, chromosome partitioning protein